MSSSTMFTATSTAKATPEGSSSGSTDGRCPRAHALDEVLRDEPGIPVGPGDQHGCRRVLEAEPAEVQTRSRVDHTAHLHRPVGLPEDRQVDPPVRLTEPGAPDDVRHVDHSTTVEDGTPAVHADDAL